jgi:DNA-binding transcriptional regulator LsrR (DeoR family)
METDVKAFLDSLGIQPKNRLKQEAPTPLHGEHGEPKYLLDKEDPRHRVIILMKAKGATNKDVAEALGICTQTVANTLKQPWAQALLVKMIHKKGEAELEKLMQVYAKDAAHVAYNIMMDEAERGEQGNKKLASMNAIALLKQALGTKVITESGNQSGRELDEEIKRLTEDIDSATGVN